jgi:hypothetical protein
MGEMKNAYKFCSENLLGRRPFGRCRWEDSTEMGLNKTE